MNSGIMRSFDDKVNFWEIAPEMKMAPVFKGLYSSDKSKGKANSSKIMWFVALYCDFGSMHYNLDPDYKQSFLSEEWMKDPNYYRNNADLLEEFFDAWSNHRDSPARKMKRDLDNKIQERRKFIRDTPYTLDTQMSDGSGRVITIKGTAAQLDKMIVDTKKLMDQVKEIEKMINEEEDGGTAKGDEEESASDKGEI